MMELSWLEGQISVEAAIVGRNRVIEAVYIHEKNKKRQVGRLRHLAGSAKIPVKYEGDGFFDENAQGKSHGGVMAKVGPRKYSDVADLLETDRVPAVVMLDGVEDPFNFGQAIRALYAAGISGLVVRRRNWLSAVNVVTRASAGASELLPTTVMDSALEAAAFFRQRGLVVACTARGSGISLFDSDLKRPLFLLIGGEKRGITRSFLDQADLRLSIPYGRSYRHSLGVTASTAVLALEILRQRIQK